MFKRKLIITIAFILSFTACSSIINKKNTQLPSNKTYAITSFWNYTQSPMAGLKVASIIESVVAQKNIHIHSIIQENNNISKTNTRNTFLKNRKKEAKQLGADYLIVGNVQEWRYKRGIDGEPVVSYTIKIIELKTNKIIFNSVGAKSGWGHKSIGVVAQEIAMELIPKFIP